MHKPMSLASRRELVSSVRKRYLSADRKGKERILDEFVAASGYHRKYAITILGKQERPMVPKKTRQRKRTYDAELKDALTIIWQAANHLCSKRLVPFLPDFISVLERFGHLSLSKEQKKRLTAISPASVDRLLADVRHRGRRSLSTTRPGALIKQQVAVRTFADWDDLRPGFFEADLVAHCGTSAHGPFLSTLVLTDVATGWTECCALLCREDQQVIQAIRQARTLLPFPLLGLDTDNGTEFLNYQLLGYCKKEDITFTRCRPYKKNDQCHVEQKNGALVRRLVGYDRYEGSAACRQLAALYGVFRLYVNFFQPSLKLVSKERRGSKVTRRYDKAQTPYQRALGLGALSEEMRADLQSQFERLDPVALLRQLECYQDALWQYAWRAADWTAPADIPVGLPASEIREPLKVAAQPGAASPVRMYRRSSRTSKFHRKERTWRTRLDPFVLVQEAISSRLEQEPGLCAKVLFRELQQQYPGQFPNGQLRTLQRRVKQWREQKGQPCEPAVIIPTVVGCARADIVGDRLRPADSALGGS